MRNLAKMLVLGVFASVAMAIPAAHALDCNGAVTQLDTPAGTVYVDDRGIDTNGVWVYLESNGVEGLQSGGSSAVAGDLDIDPCADPSGLFDTLIV